MLELSRGLSFVMYEYSGGPLRFNVTFPYISRDHVRALVGVTGQARTVPVTWIDSTTIEIPAQDEITAAPFAVTLRRFTPYDKALVKFQDGAVLPAKQLRTATEQVLYAIQETREFGDSGGMIPGGPGNPGEFPDINEMVTSILNSAAFRELIERIDLIDINSETLLERLMYDESVASGFLQVRKAISDETSARATAIDSLHAQFDDGIAGLNLALIQKVDEAFASAEEAWTNSDTLMLSTINGNLGAINETLSTKVSAAEAEAIATTKVQAITGERFSAIEQEFDTYVNDNEDRWDASWSIKINGGDTANPVVAGVALSAGSGQPSSFVIMADQFAVVNPGWTVGGPTPKVPFVVGNVGGQSTVGINGALMVDGSILARSIKVDTLSAITANMGTVNGGTFKTHTLNASGAVIDPLEFRAEMSNIGTWPLWVGAGVKNENNAVFWVDRNGNAGFDGRVSAPNIIGNFQRAIAINGNAVALTTGSWSVVHTFTLPGPALAGDIHIPVLSVTVGTSYVANFKVRLERKNGSIWESIAEATGPFAVAWSNTTLTGGSGTAMTAGDPAHSHSVQINPSSAFTNTTVDVYSTGGTVSGMAPATGADQEFRVLIFHDQKPVGDTPTCHYTRGFAFGLR